MPFHVEVSSGLHRARSFNLSDEEMRRAVIEPWLSRRSFELGDRKWDPEECDLRVLEGPNLSNPELSYGQGWANAERASEDVTTRIVQAAQETRGSASGPAGLIIETDSAVQTVAELASTYQARSADLDSLGPRIDGRDPEIAAVIVVIQRQPQP